MIEGWDKDGMRGKKKKAERMVFRFNPYDYLNYCNGLEFKGVERCVLVEPDPSYARKKKLPKEWQEEWQ